MKKLFPAAVAVLLLGLHCLAQNVDDIAAAGTFDGQQYVNKSLGLTILAPGGWTFFPYSRNAELVGTNRAKNVDPSAINTQVLFQASPPKQFGGESSAILSAGIERLIKPKTAMQYALGCFDRLSGGAVSASKNVLETQLGNANFASFWIEGHSATGGYRHVFHVTVRKNIAIFFVETFYDNKNTFAVEAALKTLRLR